MPSNLNIPTLGRAHSGKLSLANKKVPCSYCDYVGGSKSITIRHERSHTGEKPFSCSFCDKSFAGKSQLNMHERRHKGIKPFSCRLCKKRFYESHGCAKHQAKCKKRYFCKFCDKYELKSHVIQHKRKEAGLEPFTCWPCKISFSKSNALIAHKLTCRKSKKSFRKKVKLEKHKQTHTASDKNHEMSYNDNNIKEETSLHTEIYVDEVVTCDQDDFILQSQNTEIFTNESIAEDPLMLEIGNDFGESIKQEFDETHDIIDNMALSTNEAFDMDDINAEGYGEVYEDNFSEEGNEDIYSQEIEEGQQDDDFVEEFDSDMLNGDIEDVETVTIKQELEEADEL